MGTCRPMSSPYMFPTSAQQYSIIPTVPINHHCPPLYQQRPYAPMSIQRLLSIPSDCFKFIKPSTLSSVQAQPIVMIFASFSPSFLFLSKSQVPTHSTSLNHDMFPHSLSYLISCPISFILSFIFFRSFRLKKGNSVISDYSG